MSGVNSPVGDAVLIDAGRDNGRFCDYNLLRSGRWTFDFACALFGARVSDGIRMIAGKTHRPYVLAAVMAAMFMIAIEATIVSTAMPRIVGQLGGLQLYSWVFSAFLLTQTATTVVFGKLSDLLGPEEGDASGIAIFLFGSLLCGFAWSMPSMIMFRLVQGVGAGAIQPIGMTIVGDLYSAHERGKIQGYLASVWAISAVVGPLVGGLIIQHFSWAWIFWMNLPIGVLAAAGFWACLHENIVRQDRKIDHLSAGVFTIAIAAVMADLTAVSTSSRTETAFISALAVVSIALFVWQERRSPEPMISLKLWGRRPIAAANGASLLAGMVDDRADDLPARLRPGGDAEIGADGRLRSIRDGSGMADGRDARGPRVHAFRYSSGNARRQPAGADRDARLRNLAIGYSAGIRRNRLMGGRFRYGPTRAAPRSC